MKKTYSILLFLVFFFLIYLLYDECSFNPLNEKAFINLFVSYKGKAKRICSDEFIDMSSSGEFFELNVYKVKDAVFDANYPQLTEWEKRLIDTDVLFKKWVRCPLDSVSYSLYQFTLASNKFNNTNCHININKELIDPENYYCYIHINELQQYFFLYCTVKQELLYIRRKGF
jgi:hypothetical protein